MQPLKSATQPLRADKIGETSRKSGKVGVVDLRNETHVGFCHFVIAADMPHPLYALYLKSQERIKVVETR